LKKNASNNRFLADISDLMPITYSGKAATISKSNATNLAEQPRSRDDKVAAIVSAQQSEKTEQVIIEN